MQMRLSAGIARRGAIASSLAALALAASVAAGCGSSDESTTSAAATGASTTAQSGDQFADLMAKARTQAPTEFQGPTEPAKAPKDVKLTLITCASALHGCSQPATAAADAAKRLGWKVTILDGGGTARQQNAQMLNAISSGADVIANVAIDPRLVQTGLKAAKQAGIPVVSASSALSSPNPEVKPAAGSLGYEFDVSANQAEIGNKVAQWIIGDSKGKAHVAVFTDEEFPSVLALRAGLLAGLKTCTGCKVYPLQNFTAGQIGPQLEAMTTGFLRSHPDVDYIYIPFDPAAGAVVPAIAQAGLANKVKLVSVLGNAQNLDFIRKGQVQVADGANDNDHMGWALVDQTIRMLDKQPLSDPVDENEPYVVLDKTNLPPAGQDWVTQFDYKPLYLKLWQ
jgi:ribose transport system substrate-binding protein